MNILMKDSRHVKPTTVIFLPTAFLLGQGILANVWLLLAVYSRFTPVIVVLTTSGLAIIGSIISYKILPEIRTIFKKILKEYIKYDTGWKLISLMTVLLCLAWITSMGRSPYGDGSSFYLAIAKVVAESYSLQPLPGYEDLSSITLQGELHYAVLMSLGNPGAAQLYPWPVFFAGAIMLLALSHKAGVKSRGLWLILTMLFTSSAIIELSGSGKTDLFAAAVGFAAYYWASEIGGKTEISSWWLTGLFTGLALTAKITYIPTLLPSLAIIASWSYIMKNPNKVGLKISLRRFFIHALIIPTSVLIVFTPHFIKNQMLFDNALAPIGEKSIKWQEQGWNGPNTTHRILLTIPLAFTFGQYMAQIGNISPLILIFFPLGLLLPRPPQLLKSQLFVIALAAITGITAWFILRPTVLAPRYLMACLFLITIPVAKFFEHVSNTNVKYLNTGGIIATVVVILSTTMYELNRTFFPSQSYEYLSGSISDCEKEERFCRPLTMINNELEAGDRLFIDTLFRYWLRSDLIQCAVTNREINAYTDLSTPEERWSFIYGRGFEYIAVFDQGTHKLDIVLDDLNNLPAWLVIEHVPEENKNLIRLRSIDSDHRALVKCSQMSPPGWQLFDIP